jgi:hypothetical protein
MLVTNALQLVELLLLKSPSALRSPLRKEGVLHEVSTISKIELKIKAKPVPPPADPPSGDSSDGPPQPSELVLVATSIPPRWAERRRRRDIVCGESERTDTLGWCRLVCVFLIVTCIRFINLNFRDALNRASVVPSHTSSPTQSVGTILSQRSSGSASGSGTGSRPPTSPQSMSSIPTIRTEESQYATLTGSIVPRNTRVP